MTWSELPLSSKSELMRIYLENGITSLSAMKEHYNSFATGGQMNTDGSKEEENDKTYRTKQPLQEVNITADRPAWQQGLRPWDWSRARQYYSDENGYITPQGFTFLKNVASKRRTGKSDFMKDVDKLSYIPNAAMLGAGALSGAAFNPYLWTAVGLASGAQNIEDKNYKEAALDLGLTLGIPAAKPIAKMINTAVESTKLGKAIRTASEIKKAVKTTQLSTNTTENPVRNRFRLGDVEINNPELLYHVQPDNGIGLLYEQGSGAYIKDGMLFPGKGLETETPYTWWNLGKPYISKYDIPQTRMLMTTPKDNPSMLHVRSQNYPIGQWDGSRGFVTNSEYVSSEPVKIGNPYIFEPNYGYRRVGNDVPTLDQAVQEALSAKIENPLVLARSVSPEGLDGMLRFNYTEGSPSLGMMRYNQQALDRLAETYANNEGITFLFDRDLLKQPHFSFRGDADSPIKQDAARALNKSISEFDNITPQEVVAGKRLLKDRFLQEPISDAEILNNTRNNIFLEGQDGPYNEVLMDGILDYNKAKGAILNTENPAYIQMLEDLHIPYGYNLQTIPFKFKGFKKGGKLNYT